MRKVLIVFGTRPEAIKMSPLIHAFRNYNNQFKVKVCITGQHREMLDQVLEFFGIQVDYDLNLMKIDQSLNGLTADVITSMAPVLKDFKPDYLFVHGDTTTSAFAALAGYYAGIKVCHVEAGLRTFDIYSPFPEEINRQFTARIAALHFAPTNVAKDNLIREGIDPKKIHVTGNTVIDALIYAREKVGAIDNEQIEEFKLLTAGRKVVLVTCHRRENFGQGLENICAALKEIAKREDISIIYPVHLNPKIKTVVYTALSNIPNIHLVSPLEYPAFIWLMKTCSFIITDSGGIQEEGIALNKSILLLRENTERPEVIESGWVRIVGSDKNRIVIEANNLLESNVPDHPSTNLYGSGDTSEQIISIIRDLYV